MPLSASSSIRPSRSRAAPIRPCEEGRGRCFEGLASTQAARAELYTQVFGSACLVPPSPSDLSRSSTARASAPSPQRAQAEMAEAYAYALGAGSVHELVDPSAVPADFSMASSSFSAALHCIPLSKAAMAMPHVTASGEIPALFMRSSTPMASLAPRCFLAFDTEPPPPRGFDPGLAPPWNRADALSFALSAAAYARLFRATPPPSTSTPPPSNSSSRAMTSPHCQQGEEDEEDNGESKERPVQSPPPSSSSSRVPRAPSVESSGRGSGIESASIPNSALAVYASPRTASTPQPRYSSRAARTLPLSASARSAALSSNADGEDVRIAGLFGVVQADVPLAATSI
mmetsp:Transcript_3815/g.10363  ORF Transcript_3815/g.10363 Transcript_3815/m.10363 type:complete len:344 (+) Transcript_3815:2674-3705(+)